MTDSDSGFDLSRTIRRIVVLGFALIQLVLVCRILLDFGVIPRGSFVGDPIVLGSDALAAPVRGIGGGFGSFLGGVGAGFGGINMAMVVALAGWTFVETLVMRVVRKFDEI